MSWTPDADDIAGFRTAFPEFAEADYPDGTITSALVEGAVIYSLDDHGCRLAAAHILAAGNASGQATSVSTDGGAGIVSERRVGEIRVRYSYPMRSSGIDADWLDTYLMRSSYGQRLLAYMRAQAPIAVVI